MQEIAIILSSFAGVATAAAIRKLPKNKGRIVNIGANSSVKNQIHSLRIEKDILTKTISRLYQHESGLSKIQRDRLLSRYQHQLGIILAKIEKLEEASKHPDLGPVGDGLITLMDQKLSQLDQRLYELSSKISVANVQTPQIKSKKPEHVSKISEETKEELIDKAIPKEIPKPVQQVEQKPRALEITTLTELPSKIPEFPLFDEVPRKQEDKIEILQSRVAPTLEKPKVETKTESETKLEHVVQDIIKPSEQKPEFKPDLPEEENIEEDDDLDKIKGEIMKTLSKLEQAEVE